MALYDIAVDANFRGGSRLTYSSPLPLPPGSLVEVPLGAGSARGCVLGERAGPVDFPAHRTREVAGVLPGGRRIPPPEMALLEWTARYYHYPLGKLVFEALPRETRRPGAPRTVAGEDAGAEALEPAQEDAYGAIARSFGAGGHAKALLHGVTGSGKTRVYKRLMRDALARGRSVLFLLPEINLTPQVLEDFGSSLPAPIHPYHSAMPPGARHALWRALAEGGGGPRVVVGTRSAVFLPVRDLGLVVVDEEHDPSFKQEDRCPYNARDAAVRKAAIQGAPVLLGSATPSLETWHGFVEGRLGPRAVLGARVGGTPMPEVRLIDERPRGDGARGEDGEDAWPFAPESLEALGDALGRGEKAIVFINRLGYAPVLLCRACGRSFECPDCDVGMRFHKSDGTVRCHHCHRREPRPDLCPDCGCLDVVPRGFGTERVEEALRARFPSHRILRFDRDNIRTQRRLEEAVRAFASGEARVLVGTRMLSKGHNFRNMNTAVILGTDSLLNFPDFRATERVFQTLTQVAGRCGRYGRRGLVLVQTVNPDHQAYRMAARGELDEFHRAETAVRRAHGTPPFRRLCLVHVSAPGREALERECRALERLLGDLAPHFPGARTFGPGPLSAERRAGRHTWSFLLSSADPNELHNLAASLDRSRPPRGGTSRKIDMDPHSFG